MNSVTPAWGCCAQMKTSSWFSFRGFLGSCETKTQLFLIKYFRTDFLHWFSVSLDSLPCKSLPAHALLPYSVLFLYPESRYPAKWYLFKIPQCTNLAQKLEQRASPWLLQLGGIFPPQSPRSIYISSLKLQKQNELFLLGLLRPINALGSVKQKCYPKKSTAEGTSRFPACFKTDSLVADVNPPSQESQPWDWSVINITCNAICCTDCPSSSLFI